MPNLVTDPDLIKRLDEAFAAKGGSVAPAQEQQSPLGRPVTDPALIERLDAEFSKQEEPSWLMRQAKGVGDALKSGYEGVKGAIQGQQDPRFADVPGFTGEGLPISARSRLARAKLTSASIDDKAYGDIIKKTLGPQLRNVEKDQFGAEIVTYVGEDGKERKAYVNKPGLEGQDVDRFISGAVPYVATATGIGRIVKNLPIAGRAIAQGLGGGLTSLGTDVAARSAGSEQPVSAERAGTAAVFGAGGELATGLLGSAWRALFKPQYVDKTTGQLTEAGLKKAKSLGLNPDDVTTAIGQHLDEISGAANPKEALEAAKGREFNIPATLGQRSKDPAQLHLEEGMRRSNFGESAKNVITGFDELQKARIQEGADLIKGTVAPTGAASRREAGQGLSDALRSAKEASSAAEREIWKSVPDTYPAGDAKELIAPILQKRFEGLGFFPDEKLTPAAHAQMLLLSDFVEGKQLQQPYALLAEKGGRPSNGAMRKRLLGMSKAAQNNEDRAAAKVVYDTFTDWMEEIGNKGLVASKPGAAVGNLTPEQAVREATARAFTKEQRRLFTQQGRKDASGKLLENLSENATTPELVIRELFGGGANAAPKKGAVGALRRLKTIFNQNDPAAWDQVKAAYWLNITRGRNGELLSPKVLRNAIGNAFETQKSVIDAMFMPSEQAMMRRFRDAVETTTWTPPNASGTSYGGPRKDNVVRYLLRRMGTRATFQGKPIKGSIYHGLSKTVPNAFGVRDLIDRNKALQAVGQTIRQRRSPQSPLLDALAIQTGQARTER